MSVVPLALPCSHGQQVQQHSCKCRLTSEQLTWCVGLCELPQYASQVVTAIHRVAAATIELGCGLTQAMSSCLVPPCVCAQLKTWQTVTHIHMSEQVSCLENETCVHK